MSYYGHSRLGTDQRTALDAMAVSGASGVWHEGSGWLLNTPSQTDRVMQSLKRRGYVAQTSDNYLGSGYGRYEITLAGRHESNPFDMEETA